MLSAISLPNVDAIVSATADLASRTIQALAKPYTGHLDQPVLMAMPAAGSAVMDWGQDTERGFAPKRPRVNKNRDAFFAKSARGLASSPGLMKKGLTGDFGQASYTISNCVEASGSSSISGDSEWFVAEDFEHEGL